MTTSKPWAHPASFALILLGMMGASIAYAPGSLAQPSPLKTEHQHAFYIPAIDTFMREQLDETGLPGAALVVTHGGQIVHLAGYGEAREGELVTPDTQFYVASVSKSFTALAVMQLVEAGAVGLDTPVVDYIPDFETAASGHAEQVTVRHLLNQTSGLSYEGFAAVAPQQQPRSTEELLALIKDVTPTSAPGEQFDYFDPNYGIAARLVEVVGGSTFEDYLESNVFAPLEMKDSFSVVRAEDAPGEAQALAQGYRFHDGMMIQVHEQGYLGGSGGIVSTVRDLGNYLIMQIQDGVFGNHTLASPRSITTMHTPAHGIASPYAMGWVVLDADASPLVVHNWGDLESFRADLMLLPDEELGVALLYNASADPQVFEDLREGVIGILTQAKPQ